jgi:DNA-binding FadR family transcriptional regulator
LDEENRMGSRTISRAQEVVAGLTERSLAAADGTRLGQKEELRQEFGVSIGAFNEALKMAHDRGVIEVRRGPGGGIFAAKQTAMGRLAGELMTVSVDDPTIAEVFRMRNSLDPLLISDAIDHATMADINDLTDITRDMEAAVVQSDPRTFHHLAMDYQRRILAVSPNTMLRPVLSTLFDIIENDGVPISPGSEKISQSSMKARLVYFERMTSALESRNLDAAYEVMVESAVGWRPYLAPNASRR